MPKERRGAQGARSRVVERAKRLHNRRNLSPHAPVRLDDVRRRTRPRRETYRILYITHVWPAIIVTQYAVHNHAVRKLEFNDESIQVGVRLAHERANEGLCNFMCTKEWHKEGAILGCGSAKYVPGHGSLEVYRAAQSDTRALTSSPMRT